MWIGRGFFCTSSCVYNGTFDITRNNTHSEEVRKVLLGRIAASYCILEALACHCSLDITESINKEHMSNAVLLHDPI